jgi:hypothetical protein
MAACFLQASHRLLTDDLLLLQKNGAGYDANPGPPRIKLFSKVARAFLPSNPLGVHMNTGTRKLILPLLDHQICRTSTPLKAIYVLDGPRNVSRKQRINLERLSLREGLSSLLGSTLRREMVDAQRRQRRFVACVDILSQIPVTRISYPRLLANLPKVRELILAELSH